MAEITDVLYLFACWAECRHGDDYAAVELVRALSSPNLAVRVVTRAMLKETLETLSTPAH
ncbi:MAG: hypothetical protein LAO30_13585 [Acidobacteriia bacterium]|nr:hypothetical protein [Terriglobia bacterium]